MAKRTSRDFCATMEQQLKHFKPVRVNPFPLMMDASRQYQAQQAARQASGSTAACNPGSSSTTPATQAGQHMATHVTCSHCGTVLPELQVQQCHACKAVYCTSCSVINYDEREDRVFCLDCNTDGMQLTSCDQEDLQACGGITGAFNDTYCQPFCSPPGHFIANSFSMCCSNGQAAVLSAERRSSVRRACQLAAAAAAAAADTSGSYMAAMAGIGGLAAEQCSPLFSRSGLCGFGSSGGCGGGGRAQDAAVLGQWDLNSGVVGVNGGQQQPFTPAAMLPFTA